MEDGFVMTDADVAEAAAARAVLTEQMLTDAELDAYIEAMAQDVADEYGATDDDIDLYDWMLDSAF